MAKSVQNIIRQEGAVPATIALMSGRVLVGVDDNVLEEIADPVNKAVKVSRRDIAVTLNKVILPSNLSVTLRCGML